MKSPALNLSVVIPVFNEETRVRNSILRLSRFLSSRYRSYEILVIDDGSTDKTPEILSKLLGKVPKLLTRRIAHNTGKGAAVRKGLLSARGSCVIFTDVDLSTPPSEIPGAISWINKGYDVAIASRSLPGSRLPIPQSLIRRIAGRVFNALAQVLFGFNYTDTQCGFKAFSRSAARRIAASSLVDGFAFDVEMLLLARKFGFAVKEFPIRWSDNAHSTVRLIRHAPKMLLDLTHLRRSFKAQITYHPIRALPLILTSVALAVSGQLFMKFGANRLYGTGLGMEFLAAAVSDPYILAGVSCYAVSAFTWLAALSRVDLSFAFPMLSLGFVFTALFSWMKFGETLAWNRVIGISLVVAGVLLIAMTGGASEKDQGGK